jgi:hypothetical protein
MRQITIWETTFYISEHMNGNTVCVWFEEEFEDESKLKLEDMLGKKFNANTGLKK